jgi:predicted HTH domain antitoxin
MPNAGRILQILRGLNQHELRAIRREFDWCNIEAFDDKSSFTLRLRDSIERAVDEGVLDYEQFMRELRDNIIIPGPYKDETQIRNILQSIQLTDAPIGNVRKDEEWFSSQLYGALQEGLREQYNVFLEYEIGRYNRDRVDIYIESNQTEGCFLIESKLASSVNGNIKRIEGQVKRYHDSVDQRNHTFVFMIGNIADEKYLTAQESQTELHEYSNIPSGLSKLEEINKTTVIERTVTQN